MSERSKVPTSLARSPLEGWSGRPDSTGSRWLQSVPNFWLAIMMILLPPPAGHRSPRGARLGPHHADERHAFPGCAAQVVRAGVLPPARDTRDLTFASLAPELEPALEEHAETGSADRMAE